MLGLSFELNGKELNFKNIFNSFKVEINEEGPNTLTYKLCIF